MPQNLTEEMGGENEQNIDRGGNNTVTHSYRTCGGYKYRSVDSNKEKDKKGT